MNKKKTLSSLLALSVFLGLAWISASFLQAKASPAPQAEQNGYLPIILNQLSTQTPTPTSPPPAGGSYTFIAWADTKGGTKILATLSNQAKPIHPAFTIYSGDLESSGFTTSGIATWVAALNGGVSNGMSDITLTLRGNHDASNTSGWQAYFDAAGTAASFGATRFSTLTQDLSYSFDYGNARFIGLDVTGDASLISAAEISYLDGVLTDAENRGLTHAFLFFHGPIYAISSHTSCATRTCPSPSSVVNLVKVLNKHPIVSAIFNGHEHLQAYVHIDSSRMPEVTHPFEEFIAGSAGAELYNCSKTYRFDYCGSYDGFAEVSVNGKAFTVKIYQKNTASPVKTYSFTK